jgi:hypothetical protein
MSSSVHTSNEESKELLDHLFSCYVELAFPVKVALVYCHFNEIGVLDVFVVFDEFGNDLSTDSSYRLNVVINFSVNLSQTKIEEFGPKKHIPQGLILLSVPTYQVRQCNGQRHTLKLHLMYILPKETPQNHLPRHPTSQPNRTLTLARLNLRKQLINDLLYFRIELLKELEVE